MMRTISDYLPAEHVDHQLFINGQFVDAADQSQFDCISPATGKRLCQVSSANEHDVDRAVKAARDAFNSGAWRDANVSHRKKILLRLAQLVESNAEKLAIIETWDTGKPIRDSRAVDMAGSVQMVRWFAESVDKLYDEIAPTDNPIVAQIRRTPLGVIAAVTPWNFPLLTALTKIIPALAVGNSVVLKPSELSPLSALYLARLGAEAGLPDGVLNVVTGSGGQAGAALGLHPDVDALLFTGSTATGKRFMQYSGASNLKKISLECGGKSANIVLDDCPDIDKAVQATANGIFFNAGQICNAGSRLILQRAIAEQFKLKLAAHLDNYKPGDPMDSATTLGSMISSGHADKVRGHIREAEQQGARIYAQARAWDGAGGFDATAWVPPTLIDQVNNSMRIAQEEVFGPVLAIMEVDTVDEALQTANDSQYGLAAAIWTSDMRTAHRAQQTLHAGFVWVNSVRAGHIATPFGGVKQSGFGRDKSLHAFDNVSYLKTTWYDYS